MKALFLFASVIITSYCFSQSLQRPESVEYDVKNNRILISNKGPASNEKGYILQANPDGSNLQYFADSNHAAYNAIEIVGDTVFVSCLDGHIYGFRLSNGELIIDWDLLTAVKPNGLSHDKYGNLYSSDAKENDVYKINIATGNKTLLTDGTGEININGIYMDNDEDRLFLCGWESDSKYWDVYAADITTGAVSNIYDGPLSKVDGMARDRCGNYYLSFWSEDKVYKYDNDAFENPVLLKDASDGLDGPADIGIDTVNNNLLIPNLNNNSISIVNLESHCPSASTIKSLKSHSEFVFPNPSNGILKWNSGIILNRIELYNLQASLISKAENLEQRTSLSIGNVKSGCYLVKGFLSNGEIIEQKLLLIN